jgi:tetratricopeptide (TPR) repeat protein
MRRKADDIRDLVEAVADGEPVDWDAAESLANTPAERRTIRRLRVVARVAGVYRDAGVVHGAPDSQRRRSAGSVGVGAPLLRLAPGTRWGGLEVIECLGAGTFGDVYRARDLRLDRDVALKLLRGPQRTPDAEGRSEIVNEGRLLARVRHPNVASVHGADRVDGRVGLWMELVDGSTLEHEARERGCFPAEETAGIGVDLCRALGAVHAAGLLHRDVKAQNVMRDRRDGRIVLMDFSAGHELADGRPADVQLPPSLAGSPIYLAPEVLAGEPPSERSDLYSLGVLLFRLASGVFPVEGRTMPEIRKAHAAGARSRLADLRPDLPPRFAAVVDRAVCSDPSRRFQSATEMERALLDAMNTGSRRAPRGHRWLAAGAATVLVAAAGLVVVSRIAGTAVLKPPAPANRPVVLVGSAQGLADRPGAAEGLERAIERELTGSRFVEPASRDRVSAALALMRKAPNTRLETSLAREVALRDGGIAAVVASHILTEGNAFVIATEILAPRDGALVATVSDRTSVIPGDTEARRHAGRVREALQTALLSMERPEPTLDKVTTSSLIALQLHTKASALIAQAVASPRQSRGEVFAAAETLLRQAVAADPAFASAWLYLAEAIYGAGPRSLDYQPYMERAASLASGVSEHERYEILGWAHLRRADITGDRSELERAIQTYEAHVRLFPDDRHVAVRDMTMYVGRGADAQSVLEAAYRELGRTEDAERVTLSVAALHPSSTRLQVDSSRIYLRRGLLAQSREAAQRAVAAGEAESPERKIYDVGWARLWDAHAAWLRNDAPAALAAIRRAQQRWPVTEAVTNAETEWSYHLWKAYQGLGRFRDAEALARTAADSANRRRDLTVLALDRGDVGGARDLLRPQLATFDGATGVMSATVRAGLLGKADWIVRERHRRQIVQPWMLRSVDEGQLRVAQGRHAEGLALLEPLMAISAYGHFWIYPRTRESVAIARRARGELAGAVGALEAMGAARPAAVSYHWWVSDWLAARTLLAELHHEAGDSEDAQRVGAEVRSLLAVADEGHPLLARLARLQPGAVSTAVRPSTPTTPAGRARPEGQCIHGNHPRSGAPKVTPRRMRTPVIALTLGLAVSLAALAIGRLSLARTAEWKLYDLRMRASLDPAGAPPEIAIVEIDEQTLRALEPVAGRWPWPRVFHAGLIDFLARGPARAIAYDVLFLERDRRERFTLAGEPMSGADSDAALVEAVAHAGNVVLLADATYTGGAREESPPAALPPDQGFRLASPLDQRPIITPPFDSLAKAARSLGHTLQRSKRSA